MNHPFIVPVDPGSVAIPICYDALHAWARKLPDWFSNPDIPNPKAALLCGLPTVGRGASVKAIARLLGRPLFRIDPACDATGVTEITALLNAENAPCVLWLDEPSLAHTGIHRWVLDQDAPTAFVIFTSASPHKLPEGFMRSDVIESRWHLDLPDNRQRCELWHEVITAVNPGYHSLDTVRLAQLSIRFTGGEIQAAFDHARREAGRIPEEGELIDAILALRPISHSMEESLACLRAWARVHALEAASQSVRAEQ